jgi:hypothetical protein
MIDRIHFVHHDKTKMRVVNDLIEKSLPQIDDDFREEVAWVLNTPFNFVTQVVITLQDRLVRQC